MDKFTFLLSDMFLININELMSKTGIILFYTAVIYVPIIYFIVIRKFVLSKSLRQKWIYAFVFLLLSNLPFFKMFLVTPLKHEGVYIFQTCDAAFSCTNKPSEAEWREKIGINKKFEVWKTYNVGNDDKILYRAFEFKWWKFWEYGTYFISDVYSFPILPKDCKVKILENR